MNAKELDEKFQNQLKAGIKDPPCPQCNGKIIVDDCWLFTINTCEDCGWSCHDLSDYTVS